LVRELEQIQKWKDQPALSLLDEEIYRLDASICEVPYSALPLEKPEIICFAGRIEELTGYTIEEILTNIQLWINLIHPADRDRVLIAFAHCKIQGTPFEIEYRVIHKDGSLRYVIDEGEPVFNDEGQVTRIDGIITDVSEYKKARICIC